MNEPLTTAGYEQTKQKLQELESRLAVLEQRSDITPTHLSSVRRSHKMMMREYLQDIKLYEVRQRRMTN